MRSGRRRATLVAFLAATLAVGFGSYAWACGPNNPHTALLWICNLNVHCNIAASLSSAPSGSQKWARATGLSTGSVTYDMKWTAGSHLPVTDTACESGSVFAGGANLLPSSPGSISWVTITFPIIIGVITICMLPGGYVTSPPTTIIVASHSLFTLT